MKKLVLYSIQKKEIHLSVSYYIQVIDNSFVDDWGTKHQLKKEISSNPIIEVNIPSSNISFKTSSHFNKKSYRFEHLKQIADDSNLEISSDSYGFVSGICKPNEVFISFDEKEYKKLIKALEEEKKKAYEKNPEAKEMKKKEEKRKKEKEICTAKKIIEKIEMLKKENGHLMTRTEAEIWKKNYNQLMNEGGDGYVPEPVTEEDYIRAKNILANL